MVQIAFRNFGDKSEEGKMTLWRRRGNGKPTFERNELAADMTVSHR